MNVADRLSKETAVKNLGSIWCVDHAAKTIFEHLGTRRPSFNFNDTYTTLDEAAGAVGHDYQTQHLPDDIRLPRHSPIALDRELTNATTSVLVLRFDDLLVNGLRLEKLPIAAVEYATAPHHLAGRYNFVASQAYLSGEIPLRVRISHDALGFPLIDEVPQFKDQYGWANDSQRLAFLDREHAEAKADEIGGLLLRAADWRNR